LHTFPGASQKAAEVFGGGGDREAPAHPGALTGAFGEMRDCGILLATLEGKAVSSSFVGAYAGGLVVGELLRGLHGGVRCEMVRAHLRSNDAHGVVLMAEAYQNRLVRSGYVELASPPTGAGLG